VGTSGSSGGTVSNSAGGGSGTSSGGSTPDGGIGGGTADGAAGSDAAVDGSGGSDAALDGGCASPVAGSTGNNPLFDTVFTADPAPFVYGCTFYINCGHDLAASGQNAFIMADWFELSSTDMVHWTKTTSTLATDNTNTSGDTAVLSLKAFSWANANAWAGQMVTANGKFYWYVPVQQASDGSMAIGVAVADSPTGPFKDALGHALINDAFEMSNEGYATPSDTPYTIDPTVFVDDDGTAYLHYGGFGRMNEAQLGTDMISIVGKMKEDSPQGYFEAAYLTKRMGITPGPYYEIYAAGANPATIDYATSQSPMGPWTYKGRVLDQMTQAAGQTDAPTNHAGVAEFLGQWYIVYHVSNGPNGGGTYRREVQVDKMNFNADGTIQHVTPSAGLRF
jgi:hypothetical protein